MFVNGVRIDAENVECDKVKSRQWGDLQTFTEENENPQCLGTLRLKKGNRILCLQKEVSDEDYLQCDDDGPKETTTTSTATATSTDSSTSRGTTLTTRTTSSTTTTPSPCPPCDSEHAIRVLNPGARSCTQCKCRLRGDCDTDGGPKGLSNNVIICYSLIFLV